MFILSVLSVVVLILIVPFILGMLFERSFPGGTDNTIMFSRCIIMGVAIMLAAFQIVAVPAIIVGTSFTLLLVGWTVIIAVLICVSMFIEGKTLEAKLSYSIKGICENFKALNNESKIIWLAAGLLILFEMFLMIFRTHMDTDDARFIAEALEAYEKNSLLRIHPITGQQLDFPIGEMKKEISSPYPIFIAVLAKLTMTHPAVLAHAILPPLLILASYIVAYIIAGFVFKDKSKIPVFMLILAGIVLFSFESIYTWGYTMLAIIWQGRSIAAVVILPFLWYVMFNITVEEHFSKLLYVVMLVVSVSAVCLSGMGGIMAPLIVGAFALTYLCRYKRLVPSIIMVLCVMPSGIYMIIYKLFV